MLNTLKYTLLSLIKEKTVLIWAILFPLVLGTLFAFMFTGLDDAFEFTPIPVAVVDDAHYRDAKAFVQMVDAMAETGEEQVLELRKAKSVDEATQLLSDGAVLGYFLVSSKGEPELFITASGALDFRSGLNRTILKNLLDTYLRNQATIMTLVEKNPMALADPTLLEDFFERTNYTSEISVIANRALTSVRYFYALLGFASIMAANIGMIAVTRTQANLSPLGARRALGATGRFKTLTATILATWMLSFACLLVAYCYLRFVFGINFGSDVASIFGLVVASLMTTALGACVGAIPKLGEMPKAGILVGMTSLLTLFAGLYGDASMRLADEVTRVFPYFQMINPSKQVTNLFYCLYFYDGYDQFFLVVLHLLIMAAVLFACTTVLVRRQRYASL
ncbi:MAG: ABC transporter permease [Coriobacteriia bacterium]|nr:ABC transporter permease [Coriobacteriia bacterium]